MSKELLDKLAAFKKLGEEIEKDCRAFVVDISKPLEERWAFFCAAPNKKHESFYDDMGGKLDSAYDDLNLDRHQTFDVCDWVNESQEELNEDCAPDFVEKLGQEGLNEIKEHYMKKYLGSWENDW
jgi:hypothetical protein